MTKSIPFFCQARFFAAVPRHLVNRESRVPSSGRIRRHARHSTTSPGAPVDFRIMQGTVFHFTCPFIFQIKI